VSTNLRQFNPVLSAVTCTITTLIIANHVIIGFGVLKRLLSKKFVHKNSVKCLVSHIRAEKKIQVIRIANLDDLFPEAVSYKLHKMNV
jgi:hypothetical protein